MYRQAFIHPERTLFWQYIAPKPVLNKYFKGIGSCASNSITLTTPTAQQQGLDLTGPMNEVDREVYSASIDPWYLVNPHGATGQLRRRSHISRV